MIHPDRMQALPFSRRSMRTSGTSFRVAASLAAIFLGVSLAAPDCRAQFVLPFDGMVITRDTTFVPGTYSLPHGVSIGASHVVLDLNGATLLGTSFKNYGVTSLGRDHVTVRNGHIHGYYYGIRLEGGGGLRVENNDLSDNWV